MPKKDKLVEIPILKNHDFMKQIGWATLIKERVALREDVRIEIGYRLVPGAKEVKEMINNKEIELLEISLINVRKPKK